MTNWLYVDNLRGFADALIPLKDVNFLVGENSTGKTSILSVIDLLGSPRFWFAQDFNTEVVKLGRFQDIVSTHGATSRNQFRIGFIVPSNSDSKKPSENYEAVLMTFVDKDNSPLIQHYNYIGPQGQAKIHFGGKQILYKFEHIGKATRSEEAVLQVFKGWTKEEAEDINAYKSLRKERSFDRRQALLYVDDLLEQMHGESIRRKDEHVFNIEPPEFAVNLVWLAPIRSRPKRTYDEYKLDFNPEGEHTPYLIRKLLKQRKGSKEFRQFLDKFGIESGLFDSIDIKGYGKELASPFELRVILNGLHLALSNVGYGVSQALPVVVEMFARRQRSVFTVQQPEVHLHPRAQAALGDVIFQLATEEKKRFYIETHSDYTIDRFRLNYRNNVGEVKINSQILFFVRGSEGNCVVPIEILKNGEYPEEQPKAFREFFIHEQMRLLGL